MKTYNIPVVYEMWGLIRVEAETLQEAMAKAMEGGLPPIADYIDDSMKIDAEGIEIHNPKEH